MPVTYLTLFVLLITLISATYSYAVIKIGARGAALKASVAKQNMQSLDDAVQSVAWSAGASGVIRMNDCGEAFRTAPSTKNLVINFTDEKTVSEVLFNSSVGKASYELETSDSCYDDLFIRGDGRAIINQSSFTTTQLYTKSTHQLILCYRPSATATVIGNNSGKPSNLIRIYVINLNSSQTLMITGEFRLKITSVNLTATSREYEFNSSIPSVALKVAYDEVAGVVWLPIQSNGDGAFVTVEVVVCNVRIQIAEA